MPSDLPVILNPYPLISTEEIMTSQSMTAPSPSLFHIVYIKKEVIPESIRIDFILVPESPEIKSINRFRDY